MLGKYKNNNKKVFIGLYDSYATQIYRFILFKTNSIQDAEDLTSEVFFRFWKNNNGDFDVDINNPRALLYRIASNLLVDFYRKKNKETLLAIDSDDNFLNNLTDDTDLYKRAELNSDIKHILKSIDKIKNEYQNVVIWHYLEDLSIKEISQIMNKSQGAIRVMLHRALNNLKKEMKKN